MVFCLNCFPTLAGLPLPLECDLLAPLPFGERRAGRTVRRVSEGLAHDEVTAPACFSPTPGCWISCLCQPSLASPTLASLLA